MRVLGGWVVVAALWFGCGGEKKSGDGKASASASATGTATGTGTGTGTVAGSPATCEAACAHRKDCGIDGDVAACVTDCKALTAVVGPDQLAPYVAMACPDAVLADAGFKISVACQKACGHRASCIPEASDQQACLSDCAGLALAAGAGALSEIDGYTRGGCDAAKQAEPGFQASGACVRVCKHVIECGVVGTFPDCLAECGQNLQKGAYQIAQLDQVTAADCAKVKSTVTITPRASSGGGQAVNGDACEAACTNFAQCGLQPKDRCKAECASVSQERLARFAGATCEQLRTGDLGDQGRQCLATGKDDCPVGQMCCSSGQATQGRVPGMCLYPSLCYAPRY